MPESSSADIQTLLTSCNELLDQLQYTSDEVQSLRRVIDRVPEALLTLVPEEGKASIKTILGHIVQRDREMAHILAGSSGPAPIVPLNPSETDWDGTPTDALLAELQDNRKTLVDDLRIIASRADEQVLTTLDDRLKRIVEQDVDAFREVAMRLHSGGIGA